MEYWSEHAYRTRVFLCSGYQTIKAKIFSFVILLDAATLGNIPDGLSLAQLTEGLPDSWQEQCKKLGFSFRQMKI